MPDNRWQARRPSWIGITRVRFDEAFLRAVAGTDDPAEVERARVFVADYFGCSESAGARRQLDAGRGDA